ncbi:hypothetical protein NQD34_017586 [Periophthalmus magnuspinnatus]|nr:hypothetical protein NQD34_017586 [Periophthalmus magnuspinnatus]
MRPPRMYQSLPSRDMIDSAARSWRFFVRVSTGRSNGEQEEVVHTLKSWGHSEVINVQDSDYVLVFCPVTSRLGSDINEAESCMPGERPVVLVVLHHTFQKDYMTPRSRGIVQKLNVVLAVDMLFHNGALLDCAQNHLAWDELSQFIRGISYNPSPRKKMGWTGILLCVTAAVIFAGVVYLIYSLTTSH